MYLGVPLWKGFQSFEMYGPLISKIKTKILNWNHHLLSTGGLTIDGGIIGRRGVGYVILRMRDVLGVVTFMTLFVPALAKCVGDLERPTIFGPIF
ncbi:hypothetical protein OROMI_002721 [Orobanche minor]